MEKEMEKVKNIMIMGGVIFEGEYLNGKKNGKGKGYNDEGQLIFEGEYLKGEKWAGKLKEYFLGRLILEGELLYEKISIDTENKWSVFNT